FFSPLADLGVELPSVFPKLSATDLAQLTSFFRSNVIAVATGATPNYFAHGAADGNVAGIVAKLISQDSQSIGQSCKLNLRDSIPLQSSLFQIAQQLGEQLANQNASAQLLHNCRAELTVLTDIAMHGTVTDSDCRGIDPVQ